MEQSEDKSLPELTLHLFVNSSLYSNKCWVNSDRQLSFTLPHKRHAGCSALQRAHLAIIYAKVQIQPGARLAKLCPHL